MMQYAPRLEATNSVTASIAALNCSLVYNINDVQIQEAKSTELGQLSGQTLHLLHMFVKPIDSK